MEKQEIKKHSDINEELILRSKIADGKQQRKEYRLIEISQTEIQKQSAS